MSIKTKVSQFTPQYIQGLHYPTPFFVISKQRVLDRLADFREAFPGAAIHYAIKANSEEPVLQTLNQAGCGFEAASFYEIEWLLQVGVAPEQILYGTSVKPQSHIKLAFEAGVDRFAFDSIQELDHIAAVAPGARVYVRVAVDDSGSVFQMSEKFGAPVAMAAALLMEARRRGLTPYGISFNVGSQASAAARWGRAIRDIRPVLGDLEEVGITLEVLNLGGGYPSRYLSDPNAVSLEEIAAAVEGAVAELPYRPQLIMEPGRGLVAEAAVLVSEVIAKVQRPSGTWLYLDAGAYNALFESMAFQGTMRYFADLVATPAEGAREAKFVLAGPTGDGLDVICHDARLPSTVGVGDRVMFYHVGAYSLTLSSPFNGFPRPDVYTV